MAKNIYGLLCLWNIRDFHNYFCQFEHNWKLVQYYFYSQTKWTKYPTVGKKMLILSLLTKMTKAHSHEWAQMFSCSIIPLRLWIKWKKWSISYKKPTYQKKSLEFRLKRTWSYIKFEALREKNNSIKFWRKVIRKLDLMWKILKLQQLLSK